jgi:para-aminobenzoate synthetase/4-amino-4-deoxychorismate lyase
MNPFLHFNFINENGEKAPLVFQDPVNILQTRKLDEVGTIFERVDQALADGYYVAGYVSYEAAPAFDPAYAVNSGNTLPLVWFGVFSHPINQVPDTKSKNYIVGDWELKQSFESYQSALQQIKTAIEHGNTYQVNYTVRLHASFKGNDYAFFQQLERNQQASYAAYLNMGRYRILSASPELFFRVNQNKIETKPMKGTARRGKTTKEDQMIIDQLTHSEKEQAENVMIVDLLRNDIGKIAMTGSICVPKLFEVETYPTVHQLTSTIEAELKENTTVYDWFKALFPCGSITGAPKISTMNYIRELENSPREVYCGAIGYLTPDRQAVFNVPIRTVVIDHDKEEATYGVGGGVTWDSTVDGEYEEMRTKAQLLKERRPHFHLLETLKLQNGIYPLIEYNIQRLMDSANYFGRKCDRDEVLDTLHDFAMSRQTGLYKVRLLLSSTGNIQIEGFPIKTNNDFIHCILAKSPIDRSDPFLYHKTTHREVYHQHLDQDDQLIALLWNEEEELTEFTLGNLVVERDGKLYTPPIESGLLAGTFRQHLLDTGEIEERILLKNELIDFDEIWFINGVRGWLKVKIHIKKSAKSSLSPD